MNNQNFLTLGSFGDTLYSLCVVKVLGGGDMYVKLGGMDDFVRRVFGREPEGYHKGRYTQQDFNMIAPLLEAQEYLNKVAIHTDEPIHISFEDHWKMHLLKGWQGNQTECYALTQGMEIHDPGLSKRLLLEPWLTAVDPIRIPGKPIVINGEGGSIAALPFEVNHGAIDALGFRIGGMAYTPDIDGVPEKSLSALENLDLWIVDGLRRAPHPSHWSLPQTLAWIARLKPKRAVITNMHQDLDFDSLTRELPANVEPAYDGLKLTF